MNILKLTKPVLAILLFVAVFLSGCKKEARVYELLPADPEVETDVTYLGTLSVNFENSSGSTATEGSSKVVDGSIDTKYLINPYNNTMYIQLYFPKGERIAAYTLTSGGDAIARDPKNWNLKGSADAITWVDLDSRTDEAFPTRKLTNRYNFTNVTSYKYYRLNITANNGNSLFQLGEWGVIRVPLTK